MPVQRAEAAARRPPDRSAGSIFADLRGRQHLHPVVGRTRLVVQALDRAARAARARSSPSVEMKAAIAAGRRRRARSARAVRRRASPRCRTPAWSSRCRPACRAPCSAPRPARSSPARRAWRCRPRRARRPSCRAGQAPRRWRSRAGRRRRRRRHNPVDGIELSYRPRSLLPASTRSSP